MKKPTDAEAINHVAQKRAMRISAAKLVVSRADNEVRIAPNARATIIVKDLRLALKELIEELEYR